MGSDRTFDLSHVESREYKLMLRADRFRGGADQCRNSVEECWRSLSHSANIVDVHTSGLPKRGRAKKQRLVRFYDTDEHSLYRQAGFILRHRRPLRSDGKWNVTLKFRNSDWVRASAQAFVSDGGAKFEEDVKARPTENGFQFVPLFSRSADAATNRLPTTLGEALSRYTDLREHELPDASADLKLVRGFEAREEVFEGMELRVSGRVEAECALIIWSRSGGDPEETVAAEFSARYELKRESRSSNVATRTWSAFTALCANPDWAEPGGKTKTSFVYDEA